MTELRLLLLAPVGLLLAAAPRTETYWYSIAAADGKPIGYRYAETSGPLDRLTMTSHQEFSAARPGRPAMRVTDHMVVRDDEDGRPREITERIVIDGDWTEVRTIVAGNEAVVRRTTRDGEQVKRIALPPRTFAYDMFVPGRCVEPSAQRGSMFQLDAAEMAVDRIVDGELAWGGNGVRFVSRQRFRGDDVHAVEQIGYDGDCGLVEFTKTVFGVTVTMRLANREAALAGARRAG